jgi:hypothetical protein
MDTELLVEKIEDGERLIRQLIRDQFEIEVAFWAKADDADLWHLYIASASFDPKDLVKALRIVYAALAKIPNCSISPMDFRLLTNRDPIARGAVAWRDRYPSREPKRYHGKRLGNMDAQDLCIYPRRFPMKIRELPDGIWQVLISELDEVWLTCDSEDEARSIAAAPVLEYEALAKIKSGEQFAGELEKTADALAKYRISVGSRYMKHWAQEARK